MVHARQIKLFTRALFVGAVFTCLVALPAWADVSNEVLVFNASSDFGYGTYTVYESDGYWEGDTFNWVLAQPVEIMAGSNVIATIGTSEGPTTLTLQRDPMVDLAFSVQAGPMETMFSISSALLSFAPISECDARASAALTLTDFFGFNGAMLTGMGPTGGAYLTNYNGFVPGGTAFCEVIPQIVAPPGGSGDASVNVPETGWTRLTGPVSDMSSQVNFTLTAFDIASGTTMFEIIPEPSALLLLALGTALLRRRA